MNEDRKLKWVVINGCLVAEAVACYWTSRRVQPTRRIQDKQPQPLSVKEVDKLLEVAKLPPEQRIVVKNRLLDRGLMDFGSVRQESMFESKDFYWVNGR